MQIRVSSTLHERLDREGLLALAELAADCALRTCELANYTRYRNEYSAERPLWTQPARQ